MPADSSGSVFDRSAIVSAQLKASIVDWMTPTGARVVRPIGIQFRGDTYRLSGPGAQDWGSTGASTTLELRRYDGVTVPIDIELMVSVPVGSQVAGSCGEWEQRQTSADLKGLPVDFRRAASMQPEKESIRVAINAPNMAGIKTRAPTLAEALELTVLDLTPAQQIEDGDLGGPAAP